MIKTTKCLGWHLFHDWGAWIPKEEKTTIHIENKYHMSYIGSSDTDTRYDTTITRLTRYCERCGDRQTKHVDLLIVSKIEEKQS